MKSFLQTESWLKFQEVAEHKVWRFDNGQIRANIIKYFLPLGKSYFYIPHGPEINLSGMESGIKDKLNDFVNHIKKLSSEEGAIFIKMEPIDDSVIELLYRRGFRRSSRQIQPYKTVIVDLSLSEEHLLGKMHHKTRYNINLSQRKNLKIVESQDSDAFWKLLSKTSAKDNFSTHPKNYYSEMINFFREDKEAEVKLFLVDLEGKPIAGEMLMLYEDTAYYIHGAMDRDYKNLMAPYFMHWEVMKWAKLRGYLNYDFWGIDFRKWPGVSRFKLGWGGEIKERPGSFDLVILPLWYFSYGVARKIKNIF